MAMTICHCIRYLMEELPGDGQVKSGLIVPVLQELVKRHAASEVHEHIEVLVCVDCSS